jgi:hypothetical protein
MGSQISRRIKVHRTCRIGFCFSLYTTLSAPYCLVNAMKCGGPDKEIYCVVFFPAQ